MTEKLFYRKIIKDDLPKWEVLAKSEFLKEDFCSENYLLEQWEEIKGWVLFTEKKEWIGCGFIDTRFHEYNPEGIHFLELCIFPKFRGKGYAKYLVKIYFDNSIGYKKSACIDPQNKPSIALLTKYGFEEIERYKTWMIYLCENDFYPDELKDLDIEYRDDL